jgi:putative DNA methylase
VPPLHHRRLPHYQAIDQPLFLTWRLAGSLPANRVFPAETNGREAFAAMDALLDQARSGPVYLSRPEIARLIVEAIRHGAEHMMLYQSHAFVVMPNHVHLLITPLVDPPKITHSLKRFTARAANQVLGLTGTSFWQDESYDRLVRDGTEFEHIVAYIHANPVRAGLVAEAECFPWSSAAEAD